ncbi:MAG: hypothetical protein AB7F89_10765 [Pirellulaceae bacterium]
MQHTAFASLVFALLLAVAALVRETRLRRALQDLLRRLFQHWSRHATTPPAQHPDDRPADARRL